MLNLSGSVLAFDFGEARIGIAQGHTSLAIAHPLTTITGRNNQEKLDKISQIINEWKPNFLVVGLPTYTDGTEHETTALARRFALRLNHRFSLPVALVDERLTSVLAENLLTQSNTFGKKRKAALDPVAAMAILETFFQAGAQEVIA
ncbi:MAG: Holliday junction resolvase RuvX [Neisseriaceae bacterium]|nr:Holliday junction resolvase RuvX [Neisseriaceae bacterium]